MRPNTDFCPREVAGVVLRLEASAPHCSRDGQVSRRGFIFKTLRIDSRPHRARTAEVIVKWK